MQEETGLYVRRKDDISNPDNPFNARFRRNGEQAIATLRQRMRNRGIRSITEGRTRLKDPNTEVYIQFEDGEQLSKEEALARRFRSASFSKWCEKRGLAYAVCGTDYAHEMLFLKGPHLNEKGELVVAYYDPLRDGIQERRLVEQLTYEQWLAGKQSTLANYRSYLDQTLKTEGSFFHINYVPHTSIDTANTLLEAIMSGTYDLTGPSMNLNPLVQDGLNQRVQFDSINCEMWVFIQAMQRWLLQETDIRRRMAQIKFRQDFGADLLLKEEVSQLFPKKIALS
jgi:hypothetical protein